MGEKGNDRENGFFRQALADFAWEAADGGAIRHLADRGYTVRQIGEMLDFPASYERVRKAVWEHFTDTGVILLQEPGSGRQREKAVYVREYDKYGKVSFRKVPGEEEDIVSEWKVETLRKGEKLSPEKLAELLRTGIERNGAEASYVSCLFGLPAGTDLSEYGNLLDVLTERQREYIEGLPWERRKVYHRLDPRMREILLRLYGTGRYHGECYFLKTGEKMDF